MPDAATLGLFALAALALLLIPGPAVLFIVARSVEHGRRGGLVSVLGIHTGTLVHVAAAAVGLSAILVRSAALFTTVKLVGAAYLIALGVRRLVRPARSSEETTTSDSALRRVYWQGVVVNVLNPKTALFFFAFLPQFVHPERGHVGLQVLVLGATFVVLGAMSDSTYALLAGTIGVRIFRRPSAVLMRERMSGGVYVALGLATALGAHTPRRRAA
ncbi:MAG: LysE family translocator [Actinobacteria bacterium]|nr:LysE family translocator [Actinomycetota bacterium]